jgi:hypothetical protein
MTATIMEERHIAQRDRQEGMWAVFQGRNLLRFLIAAWPKITQQFVGLSVFNTYATYFCEPILVLLLLAGKLTRLQSNTPETPTLSS